MLNKEHIRKNQEAKERYEDTWWRTNEGCIVGIDIYNNKNDVIIEFLDNEFHMHTRMVNIKRGAIKNPYLRNKYGACFGYGKYIKHGYPKIYSAWQNMFRRVYNPQSYRDYSYDNCIIDGRWYVYQQFAEWYDNYISGLNQDFYNDYQIDKDILQWNEKQKIYGPDTCCIIPSELNNALSSQHKNRRSEYQ